MSLTKRQRELRAVLLIENDHACWYCGRHAEQIDWTGPNTGNCICKWCVSKLQWAYRRGFPKTSTPDEKKHYLDTMRIRRERDGLYGRPVLTTAIDKSRYPVVPPKQAKITPLRQKLLDRRKRDVS